MSRRITTVPFLLAALLACSDSPTSTQTNDVQLSVLNALSSSDVATTILDGEMFLLPSAGQSTGFPIAAGAHRLEARNAGGQVLASLDFSDTSGSHRTVVVAGSLTGTVSLLSTLDTASIPPTNAAKVRVIHTVPDAPPLNALLFLAGSNPDSSSAFVTPFSYGTGTNPAFPGYAVRPLGSYTVRAVTPGTNATMAETQVVLGNEQLWSVVLVRNDAGALELRAVREGGQELR